MARKNELIFSRRLFLYDGDVFAGRVKLLRITYKLSQQGLGNFVSLPGSSIGYWETQKRNPKVNTLQCLADFFAVSLDWISGRRDDPYDEAGISALETELFPLVLPIEDQAPFVVVPCDELRVPEEYADEKKRHTCYSLGVRANIIFWLNCLKYEILRNSLIERKGDSDTGNPCLELSKLSPDLMIQYRKLFVPESKPIWDLEKQRHFLKKL